MVKGDRLGLILKVCLLSGLGLDGMVIVFKDRDAFATFIFQP